MMDVIDVADQVVAPAMRAVFRDGEVTRLELRVRAKAVELTLTAQGEMFTYPVIQAEVGPKDAAEWRENLRSMLVDFVAESRFGWGQNRELGPSGS